jgi:hypothetical protein
MVPRYLPGSSGSSRWSLLHDVDKPGDGGGGGGIDLLVCDLADREHPFAATPAMFLRAMIADETSCEALKL